MDFDLSQSDASFIGEAAGDWSGAHISSAGDVNGDEYDDFLIGAEGNNSDLGYNTGATYLLLGKAAADWGMDYSLSQADASFIGETPFDFSGYSVTSAGDVNGDWLDDFLIGTLLNFANDGKDDSQTYLILGRATADWGINYSLSQADASFVGEARMDFAGHSIASAGDVNGDDLDDFLIGAPDNNESDHFVGQTYLLLGKTAVDWGMNFNLSQADASFIGQHRFDASGFSIASAGDFNGDSRDDFLIGAPHNNSPLSPQFRGRTYRVNGRKAADWGMDYNLLLVDDYSYDGEGFQDLSGSSVASAGDVNGDGLNDILIGAWGNDEGADDAGQTYLVLGKVVGIADEGSILTDFTLSQNYPNPFNPSTKIKFSVPQSSNVIIKVFDILGSEIAVLVNEERPLGSYEVDFDATGLSSGVYFYRLQVYPANGGAGTPSTRSGQSFVETKKMILLR
jgi:hypothetical protein